MKKVRILLAGSIVLVFMTAGAAYAETLTVAGTGASQEMLRQIGEAFNAENPGITVEVPDSIGSGGGVKAAGEGRVDLGRVARKIKDSERGYGLEYLGFAKIPLVFAANPSVKGVDNITSAQTVQIFTGNIENWSVLGGPDSRIRVVSRYEGDSTIKMVRQEVAGWADMEVMKRSKTANTDGENAELIRDNEGAVGFATLDIAKAHGLVVFDLDGRAPENDEYPMNIEFGLVYMPDRMNGPVKQFVDYIFTPRGQAIIRGLGAVPLKR